MNVDPAPRLLPEPPPIHIGAPAAGNTAEYSPTQSIVGQSPAIREALGQLRQFAGCDLTVLITGESGTGKELVARAIHDQSHRAAKPFVVLNCAAVPATLIASELFGYEKGAFTGATTAKRGLIEHAHRGTLFLDEIGEMQVDLQVMLLRFLQEGEILRIGGRKPIKVDVRVIAATNVVPRAAIAAGRLREDLYYRLNVLPIHLPPLREREGDIEVLADHFLREAARELRRPVPSLTPAALAALQRHQWPGNVRELLAAIRRAVVLNAGALLDVPDLQLQPVATIRRPLIRPKRSSLPRRCKPGSDGERREIVDALRQSGFNMTRAARALDVSRATFYRMLHRNRIELSSSFQIREAEPPSL